MVELDSVFFRRDLEIARDVQRASFPQQTPAIPGLTCASFYQPAHTVGGDYYDFLPLADGTWGIAIGNVSGKGIGAALVMNSVGDPFRQEGLEKTLCSCTDRDPQESLQHILNELGAYSAGRSQRDDITLVVMQAQA